MLESIVYISLVAWSSLMTWYVTKKKIKQELFEVDKISSETLLLNKQNIAIENVYEQNNKIHQMLFHFQEEILKLHDEVLKLRAENTALSFEVCQLNNTIKLLTKVNKAEESFKGTDDV